MQVYYICVSCSQMNFLRIYFSVEHCCCLWYIFILLIRAQEWSFFSPFLDNEKNILSTQWTRLRRFSVDSTMKIHWQSVDISWTKKGKSTCKEWHRFDVNNSTSIQLSKLTKYRWVLHVYFSITFQCRINITSELAA